MADRTAFVLGGGGLLGAVEVGMLRALFERDVRPDLILGTSVGALNGLVVATDPTPPVVDRLLDLWQLGGREQRGLQRPRLAPGAPGGPHRHPPPLRRARCASGSTRSSVTSPSTELAVQFQCCAASIERAAEHWFTRGPGGPGRGGQRGGSRAAAAGHGSVTSTTSTAAS